jgi:tyrosyl-tRNA synthetase
MKSPFLNDMQARGLLMQATDLDALDELFATQKVTAYIGFDPTADSLHVGHLYQIMTLRLLQKHDHKPIVLVGGATAKVGDPSGKDEMRQFSDDATIDNNVEAVKATFGKYLKFGSGESDAVLVDNSEWLLKLNYIDFLRNYGKHFSVNRMLSFDSVKLRLEREQPLSFIEFNYMIFQAYDFLELHKNYGCVLQLGGSDQWGNIVNGVDLTRRVLGKTVHGLTSPLLTTSGGAKMGKTAKGAVWLNSDKLSPLEYWQFWRNTDDADVIKYLKIFTDYSSDEIKKFESMSGAELNQAKIALADAATILCHGIDIITSIHQQIQAAFGGGCDADLPQKNVGESALEQNTLECLMVAANLCSSKGEVKRLVQGGGLKVDDVKIEDARQAIDVEQLKISPIKVSLGKKQHFLVQVI